MQIERRQPRPGCRRRCIVLPHILGAKHLVMVAGVRTRPLLRALPDGSVAAWHPRLPPMRLHVEPVRNCCSARTKPIRGGSSASTRPGYFKDGINDFVVHGDRRRRQSGGKAAQNAPRTVDAAICRRTARRCARAPAAGDAESATPFGDFDRYVGAATQEADEFYAALQSGIADPDERLRPASGLGGHAVVEAILLFRCPHNGSPATRRSRRPRRNGAAGATPTGLI